MTEQIPVGGGSHAAPRTPADRALAQAVDATGTYHGEDDPRSLGDIASDLLSDASTLIRQEVDLAKAELQQSATRAGKGAGLMGGAGVAGGFALLFASLAAWWGIAVLIGTVDSPALGWSGLIIAIVAITGYNIFAHVVDKFAGELEKGASDVIAAVLEAEQARP